MLFLEEDTIMYRDIETSSQFHKRCLLDRFRAFFHIHFQLSLYGFLDHRDFIRVHRWHLVIKRRFSLWQYDLEHRSQKEIGLLNI